MASSYKYLAIPGVLAATGGFVYLVRRRSQSSAPGGVAVDDSLNGRLRAAALHDLPDPSTVLTLGNPTWDVVLGGRKPYYLGGPTWGYYSTFAGENPDGTKRKGGTTCGTVAAYWLSKAGFPADMIDRAPTDPAPGGGFTPGASISKVLAGAQKRGWLLTGKLAPAAVAGVGVAASTSTLVLQPGDYYCIVHDGATYDGKASSGEHVEVVLDVSSPNAAGDRSVRAAAGGQKCGENECARWVTRTLTAGGQMVRDGEARRLAWIVRAT